MKMYEARELAFRKNQLAKGIEEVNKRIEDAAGKGLFKLKTLVHSDWGGDYALAEHYRKQGFKVEIGHVQTSPNDGDDYLYISWEHV